MDAVLTIDVARRAVKLKEPSTEPAVATTGLEKRIRKNAEKATKDAEKVAAKKSATKKQPAKRHVPENTDTTTMRPKRSRVAPNYSEEASR